MIKVKRGSDERSVKESRIQEYLDAGWQRVEGEEVIRLRPPAKSSKAAVEKTALEATEPKGEE
jgi:hypothetical protein